MSASPAHGYRCLLLTLMFLVASNPSSWLRSSSIVLCTSLSPPDPPSRRDEPMESISSMKMMEGACSLAMTNSSRTIRAPGITESNTDKSESFFIKGKKNKNSFLELDWLWSIYAFIIRKRAVGTFC